MKKSPLLLGAALGLALLVTGCETEGGITARAQEKSAVYSSLKPWQKKYIDKGVIAVGFTPDMVYISVGQPSKVETIQTPEGPTELWTYKNYYPTADASTMRYNITGESHFAPSRLESNGAGGYQPRGAGRNPQSIGTTSGPQGGSMEPADLQSYTFQVTFKNGLVHHMHIEPN